MASSHLVGYSRSVRAKCHGPLPCRNSSLPVGTLRYGRAVSGEFSETVEWRHWGCVTPAILDELARVTVNNIVGFQELNASDQEKIRLAVSLRRVDPSDIPPTASSGLTQVPTAAPTARQIVQKKRKLVEETSYGSIPPSTQALSREEEEVIPVEEEVRDELYCVMTTSVVGIKYYNGLVGPGEEVVLVREPHNRYDRNAIQVKNIGHVQVGHLPRGVAVKLAPLLDRQAVTVEGVINDGNLGGSHSYTLSITLKFYAPADKRAQLEPQLTWATPGQRGFAPRINNNMPSKATTSVVGGRAPSSVVPSTSQYQHRGPVQSPAQIEAARKQQEAFRKASELRDMLNSLEKVNDESRRGSLLDSVCSKDDILNLPLHPNPPGIANGNLRVDLLRHQAQALLWCIERENPKLPKKENDKPCQFWQLKKNGSKAIATKTPQEAAPTLGKGALCADAMGLGKTLTMIALILATREDTNPNFSKSTLIVAPVSVISNWEKQIADHCVPGTLSSYLYYGNNRNISAADLKKYDVVITTYQTVAGEHVETGGDGAGPPKKKKKKVERNLFEIPWKRIILDEGHLIRNPKTKTAQAAVALNGDRRWILSGTPIINSPRDLGSILTFLRICRPLDDESFFNRLLLRPLKNGDVGGAELLQALMSHICIRRTKEMQDSNGVPLIALPPVEMIKVPVTLSDEARRLYDEVEEVSKQRFENIMKTGTPAIVQSNVLSMLTRMRQLALHPGLLPMNYLEELRAAEGSLNTAHPAVAITPEEKMRLQSLLAQAIEDCEECPICFNLLDDARITTCGHMFCIGCIVEVINRDARCPMDRRPLTVADLFEKPPPTDLTQRPVGREYEDNPEGIRAGSSAKIDQLVQLLRLSPDDEKSLVFSQFTSFLDKIGETLEAEGISFVRFDGQMSAKRRQETIARFSVPIQRGNPAPTQQGRPQRLTRASGSSGAGLGCEDEDSGDDYDPMSETIHSNDDGRCFERDPSENPKVMLISLKAGALGLNLTVANNVYLMDPWWQEGIESQAVDRVNRIGQKKPVHVYQLIAENTVESKVLEIQERKKLLIKQAFSGIKSTETQRQQREARIQDLVELFGLRRQNSSQGQSHQQSDAA